MNILDNFRIGVEKEDFQTIKENICNGIYFKGTNLWILIFAIFIASLGLNVNSTAVIIGGIVPNTPTIILPKASINGDNKDNEYANGIIAAPNAANNPIPIRTNNAVAGLPNAAKPAANAVKFA